MEIKVASHARYDLQYHVVWTTKYRYKVLTGKIAERLRILLINGCKSRNIIILKGNVTPNHVHLLVSCPPTISPSQLLQYLKGKSSRMLQEEFPELKRRYWGQNLWAPRYFCRTVGNVTNQMIRDYIENQKEGEHDNFKITR